MIYNNELNTILLIVISKIHALQLQIKNCNDKLSAKL